MKEQIRRVLAVLLAVVLVAGTLPYSASADTNRYAGASYQKADAIVGDEAGIPPTDSSNNSKQADSANHPLPAGNNANPTSPEGTSTASSSTDEGEALQNEGEDLAEPSVSAQEEESTDDTAAKAAKTAQARANNNAGDFNVTGDSGWDYYQNAWISGSGFYDQIQITKSGPIPLQETVANMRVIT